MNRLARSSLLFSLYLHLMLTDNLNIVAYDGKSDDCGESIEVIFLDAYHLEEVLNGENVQSFFRRQLDSKPEVSDMNCATSQDYSKPNTVSSAQKTGTNDGIDGALVTTSRALSTTEYAAIGATGDSTITEADSPTEETTDSNDTTKEDDGMTTKPTVSTSERGDASVTTNGDDSTTTKQTSTAETTADSRDATNDDDGMTTKPTASTSEIINDTSVTTNRDDFTTTKPATTTEKTSDSREFTSKDKKTTPAATCPPAVSNGTCRVIYDGKCFTWVTGKQTFKLENASKACLDMGFQLGNIYDDCHYELIVENLGTATISIWTGMTIEFSSGSEDYSVHLRSGEDTSFGNWWYKEYPKLIDKYYYLVIAVKIKPPILNQKGIKNSKDLPTEGAFCEK